MIKLEKTETYGWEAAIRGMRNPMNSWAKSDSGNCYDFDSCEECPLKDPCDKTTCNQTYIIGHNDLDLAKRLAKGGPVHAKYRRMIVVYVDITAPLYWWKEFDTYKVGTTANSCSTMHKIHAEPFKRDQFSCEHLDFDFTDFDASFPYPSDNGEGEALWCDAEVLCLVIKLFSNS